MIIPILIGVLGLLKLSGCAGLAEEQRKDPLPKEPPPLPPKPLPPAEPVYDPCPGEVNCSCAEGVGWVPGNPVIVNDYFIRIGNRTIDRREELFTVKNPDLGVFSDRSKKKVIELELGLHSYIMTFTPKTDFQFKLGSAQPQDPRLFQRQTEHLTGELLKLMIGKYLCSTRPVTHEAAVYVTGHTDRLGNEAFNLDLSRERALKVAEGIRQWLEANRSQLIQPIFIRYAGMGEKEAEEKRDTDETPNAKQRRVDVEFSSVGAPFETDWQTLGQVDPASKLSPKINPAIAAKNDDSDWRPYIGKPVRQEIRRVCQKAKERNIGTCVERVVSKMIESVKMVCHQGAPKDNIPVESCGRLLLQFPWTNTLQLESHYGIPMQNIVGAIADDILLQAGNGTVHQSLITFIEAEVMPHNFW